MRKILPSSLALALIATLTLPSLVSAQALQIKLVSLTSPVSPGQDATISVLTAPGAACSITVVYKSGPSKAAGLGPKTTDAKGMASWTWRVGTRTTPGRWPITVACSAGSQQGTLETSFVVK